jgi:hypothetical protein
LLSTKLPISNDYFARTEWWGVMEMIGAGFYFSLGPVIIDIVLFSILYWVLKRNKIQIKSFRFGVVLHIPALILIFMNVSLDNNILNYFIAGLISALISGFLYKKINSKSINFAFHQNDLKT